MTENNLILNRPFTQNVFFDMIDTNDNTTYGTVIQRFVNDYENKDNGTLISEVYRFMSKSYRNEYFYQNTLLNKLLLGKHSSQPWLRPIVRGKSKAPVEFGAKLDISVVNGFTRLEYHSFDAYNEALKLSDMIERYKERTGCYPERILADKIYRNRENLAYCAERKIRLSGPALGRPKKDEICDKKQDYIDESERVEVERKFSLAKRKCGIGLIVTRLKETTCHCLAMSVLLLNLRKIGKVLLTEILMLVQNLLRIYSLPELAIIQ